MQKLLTIAYQCFVCLLSTSSGAKWFLTVMLLGMKKEEEEEEQQEEGEQEEEGKEERRGEVVGGGDSRLTWANGICSGTSEDQATD